MSLARLFLGSLAVLVLGVAGSAQAYCRTTTSESQAVSCTATNACVTDGIALGWSVSDIEYVLNEDGFPDIDDATLRATMAQAFGAWSRVTCDRQPMPFSTQAAEGVTSLGVGPASDEPNESVILHMARDEWQAHGYDSAAFALTSIWFDVTDGSIYGADMHFNGGMDPFGTCPAEGCNDGMTDLLDVATHEAGHFLGLAHSNVPGATMWCDAQPGETVKRTLTLDDAKGLCATYPPGVEFKNDDIGQLGTFRRNQTQTQRVRRSCAVSSGLGARDAAWGAPASLLLGLVICVRRRRKL